MPLGFLWRQDGRWPVRRRPVNCATVTIRGSPSSLELDSLQVPGGAPEQQRPLLHRLQPVLGRGVGGSPSSSRRARMTASQPGSSAEFPDNSILYYEEPLLAGCGEGHLPVAWDSETFAARAP